MNLDILSFHPALVSLLILGYGLILGSFSSVLATRIPQGKSIVTPPSSCPSCKRTLTPWENIPIISYLVLGGKCRGCSEPIGLFYPLMELGTAALIFLAFFAGGITPLGLAYAGFAVITLPLVVIDLREKRLPNKLTYSGFVWGLGVAALSTFISSNQSDLWEPLICGISCSLFFLLLNLLSRGGMGMGDVKLAGVIGVTLSIAGWQHAVIGIFFGFLAGGIFSAVLLLIGRAKFGAAIPFGPWMLFGAWFAMILTPEITREIIGLWTIS